MEQPATLLADANLYKEDGVAINLIARVIESYFTHFSAFTSFSPEDPSQFLSTMVLVQDFEIELA